MYLSHGGLSPTSDQYILIRGLSVFKSFIDDNFETSC